MSKRISSPFGTVIIDDPLGHSEEPHPHRHETVSMTPEVDIYEHATGFSVWMDLPGADKDSLQVSVSGSTLSINAKTKLLNLDGGHWIRQERRTGQYIRNLQLGHSVETDGVSATFTEGTLILRINKKKPSKTVQIEVQSS